MEADKNLCKEIEVSKLNIAVVDDEEIIRRQVKGLIEKQGTGFDVEVYASGETLLRAGISYDMIFLDIQLDGMNGIETAKRIREQSRDAVLIFISGLKDYVFEAFDVSAFHYLLKPIEESRFQDIFDRAVKEAEKRKEKGREQLFIKTKYRHITLYHRDILYAENRGRKVELHTKGDIIEIYAVMNELETQLGESFFRCHRGYLVNMAHIAEYDNGMIRLGNGECIYLAKKRYNEFVKAYMRYLRNGGTACV